MGQVQIKDEDNNETLTTYLIHKDQLIFTTTSKSFETSDGIDVTGTIDSLDVDASADITGNVTLHGNLDLQDDNDKIVLGAGNDNKNLFICTIGHIKAANDDLRLPLHNVFLF